LETLGDALTSYDILDFATSALEQQDATCSLCPLAPLPVPGRVPGMVIGTRGARGPVRILYIFSSRQMGGILTTLY